MAVATLALTGFTAWLLAAEPAGNSTRVEWSQYLIESGPDVENNTTSILGLHFCVPSDATSAGIFSMVWATNTGQAVQQVRLWTLLPPNASHPLGVPVVLYESTNASSGGTSFVPSYPYPCSYSWNLNVESVNPVVVSVSATLTFNVTR